MRLIAIRGSLVQVRQGAQKGFQVAWNPYCFWWNPAPIKKRERKKNSDLNGRCFNLITDYPNILPTILPRHCHPIGSSGWIHPGQFLPVYDQVC